MRQNIVNKVSLLVLFPFIFLTFSSQPLHDDIQDQQFRKKDQISLGSSRCSHLQGCETCDSNGNCIECIDKQYALIQDNQCECISPSATFDRYGLCIFCWVPGCLLCNEAYVSFNCSTCDSSASLQDGKCICSDGLHMVDNRCQDCPVALTDGKCKLCQLENCLRCDDENVCDECIDPQFTKIVEGQCICRSARTFNQDGYCVYCLAPGCAMCQAGAYRQYQCAACLDSTATLTQGQCICPPSKYIVDGYCQQCPGTITNNQCRLCELPNCLRCSDPTICDECIDFRYAYIAEGQCSCSSSRSFNADGYCVRCYVHGCKMCQAGQYRSNTCVQCWDELAVVQDGSCVCLEGYGLQDDGFCYECRVFGCEVCAKNNPYRCEKCVGSPIAAINNEGKCECIGSQQTKLNSEGMCGSCLVDGCQYCVAGQFMSCYQCVDVANTILFSGRCVCFKGESFNDEGYCQECDVIGCASCQTGNNSVCERCKVGFYLEGGRCQCTSLTNKINQNDECSACQVLGCRSCLADQPTYCQFCYDGAELIDNTQCRCRQASQAPNQKGFCSSCFVAGCRSCAASDPYQCRSCKPGQFSLQNGLCVCANPGEKMNADGVCELCNVDGCQSCKVGDPETCAKCFQCSAFLISGVCFCQQGEAWNGCPSYPLLNEGSSSIRSKQACPEDCSVCENGKCSECREGFYLREFQNVCIQCNPRCLTCSDGISCTIYREGWGTYKGKIAHCDVLHCAQCSENIAICEKCKENYLRVNETYCQVDEEKKDAIIDDGNFTFFKEKYGKHYNEDEEQLREQIYYKRYEQMQDLQKGVSYKVGENHFFDRTSDELQKLLGYNSTVQTDSRVKSSKPKSIPLLGSDAPEYLNWTQRGMVTSVKNQGSCGACWAFAAAAGAESSLLMMKKATIDVDLSEQYLLECSLNSDCEGTYDVNQVMALTLQGIPTEIAYPYNPYSSHPGICQSTEKIHISSSYTQYMKLRNWELISLLQDGPLVAVISASNWEYYHGGVFQCTEDSVLNHVVLLVGYTKDYWIVKNQWGEDWGQQGYINIPRNTYYNCEIGFHVFQYATTVCEVLGCVQCPSDDVQHCTGCVDGSAMVEGVCKCELEGYVFDGRGECVPCEVFGCERCQPSNPSVCELCYVDMRVDDDGACVCRDMGHTFTNEGRCAHCGVLGCETCEDGVENVCIRCEDCSAFIHEGRCVCPNGYGMNPEGECQLVLCPKGSYEQNGICVECRVGNCLACSSVGKCKQCDVTAFLFAQVCVSCFDGCESCSTLNPTLCLSCQSGHFLQDNFCYQCPQNCSSCSSYTSCLQCSYPYQSQGDLCILPCDFPCTSCQIDDHSSCLSCFPGYQHEESRCLQNLSCNQTFTCSECPRMYWLFEGKCLSCPENCQSCSNQVCSSCSEGFDLFGGQCIKEGEFYFFGNAELSKYIQKDEKLKRKVQKILKRLALK